MNENKMIMSISSSEGMNISTKTFYNMIKRIADIIFGLIGIIILIPLTIAVKILYIITGDFGKIFFIQKRIGKNGKEFKMYKYRTMIPNADEVLNEVLKNKKIAYEYKKNKKIENDPRITKAGKIIRKLSLDEFPQFVNVFLGDMSLIGNRPYLPREIKDMGLYYDNIVSTKPGLTGYWQVNGRSNTSFRRRLKLEDYYSSNYSMFMDIKIFFKTFIVILFSHGAK